MAKRLTDTNKWNKVWYQKLSTKMKLAWNYLCDNCDHAGVWDINFDLMSYQIGEQIDSIEFINTFSDKIKIIDNDKIFIQSFIDFQYGKLNPNSKVHKSVIEKLEKIQKTQRVSIEYANSMDTDIATTKDNNKDKNKEKEEETGEIPKEILESLKISYQFSEEIIEEVRKDAWIKYLADDKGNKIWKRFVVNYFKNEKDSIRTKLIQKSKTIESGKIKIGHEELINRVINNSHLQALDFQRLFTENELNAIRAIGGSRTIANANSFELNRLKKELGEYLNQNSIKVSASNESDKSIQYPTDRRVS